MVEKYFFIAIAMFIIGLIGILKRQNLIMLFISSEILLNAANLALAASKMHQDLNGQVFALFVMGVAACEVAVGVAFCVLWYRRKGTLELKSLKEEV